MGGDVGRPTAMGAGVAHRIVTVASPGQWAVRPQGKCNRRGRVDGSRGCAKKPYAFFPFCCLPPRRHSRQALARALRRPCSLALALGDTPESSVDASMDTASPVASRGHSLAIDSVGARCHWLYEHAYRRMSSR